MPAGPGQIIGSEIESTSNAPYMANVGSDSRLWTDSQITSSGVPIDFNSKKLFDTGNSTTTPLVAGGSFVGSWIDTTDYVLALTTIITDQDAATDGLKFEVSNNGSTVLHPHNFTPLINTPDGHHYPTSLEAQYFRVNYTNGTTPQATFVVDNTLFKNAPEDGHVHPVEGTIDGDHPAPIRRTVLVAKRAAGDYDNIQSTNGNNLKISVEEANGAINPQRADLEGGGYVTVGTTAVELTFTAVTNTINIESKITNTGTIWIGKSNVTNTGANALFSLQAGQARSVRYDDVTNSLYAVSDTASQSVLKGALI